MPGNDTETLATVRCAGTKRDGEPCNRQPVGQVAAGWRCAWHDTNATRSRMPQDRRSRRPRPPVKVLRTVEDALALSSWAAIQSARGNLRRGDAADILHACREFRQCLRDSGIMAEFEQLKQTVARLSAAKEAP